MIVVALSGAPGSVGLAVGTAYVLVGLVVAWRLGRAGFPRATALSALAVWPLLWPVLRRPPSPSHPGPFAERIADALHGLERTMADPAADEVAVPEDLAGLVADLRRADERLALVDRVVREIGSEGRHDAGVNAALASLRHARAATAAEVEAVLDGIVQLRLQIGLRSLAGNSVPVRERLRDLRARLAAADEIAGLELGAVP
jgi:hypothetical protein